MDALGVSAKCGRTGAEAQALRAEDTNTAGTDHLVTQPDMKGGRDLRS